MITISRHPRTRVRTEATFRLATTALIGLLVVLGVGLRLYHLERQLVGDDEVHLVRAALQTPFPEILFSYDSRDYSSPMAALARWWLIASGRLPLESLRVIPLLAGIGLLWCCGLGARGLLTRSTSLVWLALVAFSPWLIGYSRIARSYAPLTLLAIAAGLATVRWRHTSSRRWPLLAAALLALATWFHPLGIAVAAGTLSGALLFVRSPGLPRLPLGHLAAAISLFVLGIALFLVPGWASFYGTLKGRAGRGHLSLSSLAEAARLLGGHASWWAAGLIIGSASLCLALALRRRNALAQVIVGQCGCLSLAVLGTIPAGASDPLPLARYFMPITPWLLLGPAVAAGWAWDRVHGFWPRTGAAISAVLAFGVFIGTGPLGREELRYTSLMHHQELLRFTRPLPSVDSMPLPRSYRLLASQPGSVIEFPWWYVWKTAGNSLHSQRVHHLPLFASVPEGPLSNPQVFGPTMILPDPNAWLASSARWLVLHSDSVGDELRLALWEDPGRSISRFDRATQNSFIRHAEEMALRLERDWGPADVSDDQLRVWDLARVRSGRRR